MKIASHLTASRHNVFYFRFPIPQNLHPEHKQSHVRLSLHTRCPQEALHISRALSYVGNQAINNAGMMGMEYQKIREVLQEHFKSCLERSKQRIATQGRLPALDKTALQNSKDFAIDALEHDDYTFAGSDAEIAGFIDNYTLPIKPDTKEYAMLRGEFLKAFRDYCTATLKHDAGLENYDYTTPESQANPLSRKTNAKKLASSIETYSDEKLRLKQWREHIAKDYQTQFNLLLRFLGQDASLHISPEVASDIKNTLLRLPKNMNKKIAYKDKSIGELLELSIPASERLSAVSVAKYIRTYSTFYDWAVKRKDTDENNFAALVDNVKKVYNERDEFSPDDIRRIFTKVLAAKKPHQKWGTLIGFYTGARLNEIAQLEVADIVQEDGVWCFRFCNQSLKYISHLNSFEDKDNITPDSFRDSVLHSARKYSD